MKKNKLLSLIIFITFFLFICSYYISNSGYYEYELTQKTILTNEKIKEFEQDVQNNKDIDIKQYLDEEETNYSNKITNLMYEISDKGNKLMRKGITALFKKLSYLVQDE